MIERFDIINVVGIWCLVLIVGSLWQINILVDCFVNDWPFTFPLGIKVFYGQERYLCLDFFYAVIIISATFLVSTLITLINEYIFSLSNV